MAAVGRIGRALRKVGAGRSAAKQAAATGKKAAPAAKKSTPGAATTKKAAPAKKSVAKKAPAKKAPAKKAPAKKAPAKKASAKKSGAAAKAAPATKAPAKKTPAKKAPAKKAPAKKAPAKAARIAVPAGSEWTREELAAVRSQIVDELADMRAAYNLSMRDLDDLQRAGNDGAGDDQADAGSKTFEREQEQSIAANRYDLMIQYERALERIDNGTYGYCESCGKPIPKARLKAFPAATLDVACKQLEERR